MGVGVRLFTFLVDLIALHIYGFLLVIFFSTIPLPPPPPPPPPPLLSYDPPIHFLLKFSYDGDQPSMPDAVEDPLAALAALARSTPPCPRPQDCAVTQAPHMRQRSSTSSSISRESRRASLIDLINPSHAPQNQRRGSLPDTTTQPTEHPSSPGQDALALLAQLSSTPAPAPRLKLLIQPPSPQAVSPAASLQSSPYSSVHASPRNSDGGPSPADDVDVLRRGMHGQERDNDGSESPPPRMRSMSLSVTSQNAMVSSGISFEHHHGRAA